MPDVEVGSLWRRKPPGREAVRVERVWEYLDEGLSVRAHPTTGGRPLVAPVAYLTEHYTRVLPPGAISDLGGWLETMKVIGWAHHVHLRDDCENPQGRIKFEGQWVEFVAAAGYRHAQIGYFTRTRVTPPGEVTR